MSVAAIDVGTNTVRLLVLAPDGTEIARHMQITRLGQGVDATHALHPDAVARTLGVLTEYESEIARLGVERMRVTATSAVRDATNRSAFIDPVTALFRQPPEVLSGAEEARLCFEGTTTSLREHPPPFLVLDIGGGSTEFVLGTERPEHLISLQVGSVRITERHRLSERPSETELADAHASVRSVLEASAQVLPFGEARTWLGVAGTITTFAALAARLSHYDPKVTHGYRLTSARFFELYSELMSLSTAGLGLRLFDKKRVPVILGGAVVLGEIFRFFGLEELIASERDILDGIARSLLEGRDPC